MPPGPRRHSGGSLVCISRSRRTEPVSINAKARHLGFQRLPRDSELGRRTGWTSDPAPAFGQRRLDELQLAPLALAYDARARRVDAAVIHDGMRLTALKSTFITCAP
jgi:hypothetical protein